MNSCSHPSWFESSALFLTQITDIGINSDTTNCCSNWHYKLNKKSSSSNYGADPMKDVQKTQLCSLLQASVIVHIVLER